MDPVAQFPPGFEGLTGGSIDREHDPGRPRVGLAGELKGHEGGLGDGIVFEHLNVVGAHRTIGQAQHAAPNGGQRDG